MKESVQKFGRFLSGMVMPNIAVFIAWGFITALFIPTGWAPNETLAQMVTPMQRFLLPTLIAYTGGKMVYDVRGGVVGAAAAIGILAGTEDPMFIGAMIAGPLGGWLMKKVDGLLEGKIPAGFEMLVNNFSAGILGALLAVFGCLAIEPLCVGIKDVLVVCVDFLVKRSLLPLTSLFVEPAKILFLNNAINHGIFTPLGMDQVAEAGKSIFFLIEANPGPGLGLLLAYCFFGKGSGKSSAPGAIIIHFLGGIHEIYFPYVLMKPLMIFPMIIGSACGIMTFEFFGAGLVAGPSPGSIFAYLALTPKGNFIGIIAGVLVATVVSFLLASLILKTDKKGDDDELEASMAKSKAMKQEGKDLLASTLNQQENSASADISYIAFACDAGLGSSALGATAFKKRLQKIGIEKTVRNYAIEKVPAEADIIVTHESLLERARLKFPDRRIVTIQNFMNDPNLDALFEEIKTIG